MEVKSIKQWLSERGVDKHLVIQKHGRNQYLFNLLTEFNDLIKKESKKKIIEHLEKYNLED
jgi:hypothetical protein